MCGKSGTSGRIPPRATTSFSSGAVCRGSGWWTDAADAPDASRAKWASIRAAFWLMGFRCFTGVSFASPLANLRRAACLDGPAVSASACRLARHRSGPGSRGFSRTARRRSPDTCGSSYGSTRSSAGWRPRCRRTACGPRGSSHRRRGVVPSTCCSRSSR